MTMGRVWLAAISLAAVMIVILWKAAEYSHSDWTYRRVIPAADIAFLGTSLVRDAVPDKGPASGVLGDGRSHVRVWGLALDEQTETRLLNAVIDAGIGTIFLEPYPYIREFASDPRKSINPGWTESVEARLVSTVSRLRRGIRTISNGLLVQIEPDEVIRLARTFDGDLSHSKRDYPLRLTVPRDPVALGAAVHRARLKGLNIIIIGLPRSQSLVEYLGADQMQRLQRHVEALAASIDAPLWSPANAWANDRFVDPAHLNWNGRQDFVSALRDKFGGR